MIDVIFASEKRKNMLLLLQDGPKEMKTILKSLKTTRTALLPQVKILRNHFLVTQSGDVYELTTMGKVVVDETKPFLETIDALDQNEEYLASHNIDCIPNNLLKRINEIKDCEIIEPSLLNTYEVNKIFSEMANKSNSLFFVVTFMHPDFPLIMSDYAKRNIKVSMILNKELFEKHKNEWYDEFKHFLGCENIKYYVCEKDIELLPLSISDQRFVLRLLSKNNEFSNKQLYCYNPKARQWSKDLFNYYLKDSTAITEI
ncbi:winged helix-turn-helix domain-containing protein [Methanolobus sp. ZRKC5]|uniref:helix-turn-helix transcriptional regulator n=1 Tax=unclassified Methanolobus TaxID=2629569 RepID=UPI00313D39D6